MSQREEFIIKALEGAVNMSTLCRVYEISRKTGYKWLNRYRAEGRKGLQDRSRRPHHSPLKTAAAIEQLVVQARAAHPAWGGRKLQAWLQGRGHTCLPAVSTITAVLRRHNLIDPQESLKHKRYQRFERATPNELWQMDFKGHFPLDSGQRCHPLTVLDDHSRFLLGLRACEDEAAPTVQAQLTAIFRQSGLPEQMLMDNGSPWGDVQSRYTAFELWLLGLGIRVSHSRPYHPQTQGKDERLHRTLKAELLSRTTFGSIADCQAGFDGWRAVYNLERPHEALGLRTPVTRYCSSSRAFPETLPALRFPPGAAIRKVDANGIISFQGRRFRVGKAFRRQAVGLLHDPLEEGVVRVFFNEIPIRSLDLKV